MIRTLGLALLLALTCQRPVSAADSAFSHSDWASVLRTFVDHRGFVDYAGLAANRDGLDRYVQQIAEISPQSHPGRFASREEELAYYINAYNALVFVGVLDLPSGADTVWGRSKTGYGFFVRRKFVVGGERINLRRLENEFVRDRFEDPRIHAALNCASRGCPRLPMRIFAPGSLEEQLDEAIVEFVNDEQHVAFDLTSGTATLSKVFDWFRSDFEEFDRAAGGAGGLIDYVNRYRSPDASIPPHVLVEFGSYDKSLNRQGG